MKKYLLAFLLSASALAQQGVFPGASYDKRPLAVQSTVGVTVAAGGSCQISTSPSTGGSQPSTICYTGSGSGPGTLSHVHITLGPNSDNASVIQNSTLTFNCDGEINTVPFGLFFLTQDNPKPFSTDWNASFLGTNSFTSNNRRMELDYTSGCNVTFNNGSVTGTTTLFAETTYRLGTNVSRPTRQHWHAYVGSGPSTAPYAIFTMLPSITDLAGGELESISLFGSASSGPGWLEGYTQALSDGNVAAISGGTEDFFGSGYYGVNSTGFHATSKWGEFYSSGIATAIGGSVFSLQTPLQTYDAVLYRNFQTSDQDNLLFKNTLTAIQPNGNVGKPFAPAAPTTNYNSLVTFWTHDAIAAPVTYSPVSGTVSSGSTVTLSSAVSGATLCSTLDGSIPTANGAGTCTHGTPGSSVTVTPPVTIAAIASKTGFADGLMSTSFYSTTFVSPTYRQTCNNTPGAGTTTTVSCTITPTAGDFIFALCRGGNTSTPAFTTTSSPANTFAQISVANAAGGSSQGSYAFGVVGSSTTFTCTVATGVNFQGIQVLDYAPGSTTAFAAGSGNGVTGSSTFTSNSVSVTGSAFYIVCADAEFGPPTLTAGLINGSAATGRTLTSPSSGCQDLAVTPTTSSAVGTILGSASGNWDGSIIAIH